MRETRPTTALAVSTVAFTVCFAAWVTNAVLVTWLVSSGAMPFTDGQVSWLLAVPVLTGALSRLPLGILTDRYGGHLVFPLLMLASAASFVGLSYSSGFSSFLVASLCFGLAGGSFAVGAGYVSAAFTRERQGMALGVFGIGNIGAAVTTLVAPTALLWLTADDPEGWRWLPRIYAALLLTMAGVFAALARRIGGGGAGVPLAIRLAPLKNPAVWRFGFYYFLVFGGFVACAQYLVPYSVNVYHVSVATAGVLASAFSLPSGAVRAVGGWLSDRFGARAVMSWVFAVSLGATLFLAIPRMDVRTPGMGVSSAGVGAVTAMSDRRIAVGERGYDLDPAPLPADLPSARDDGTAVLPAVARWHEPTVALGESVARKQLLAGGTTDVYYPANIYVFGFVVMVLGAATGLGSASVFKLIPEQFPGQVGTVGGMVSLIGGMGGFALPLLFSSLVSLTGLWTTCWMILAGLAAACSVLLAWNLRQILAEEAPDLARLIERRPVVALGSPLEVAEAQTLQDALKRIPFFAPLSPSELAAVVALGAPRQVAGGERLFLEGDPGDALWVLVAGEVVLTCAGTEVATVTAGKFFGELALLDGQPRSATATARSACRVLLIPRSAFLQLLAKSPRMVADLLVGLSATIRATNLAPRTHHAG